MQKIDSENKFIPNPESIKFQEKCGVAAAWTNTGHSAQIVRAGAIALEHRGQDSAGLISVDLTGNMHPVVGMGRARDVLTEESIEELPNSNASAIQTRYATDRLAGVFIHNAQPFMLQRKGFKLGLGHNGNYFHKNGLEENVVEKSPADSDSGYLATLLIEQRCLNGSWLDTFKKTLTKVQDWGTHTLAAITEKGEVLFAIDPSGNRPGCYGVLRDGSGWAFASESVALEQMGADFIREMKGGEIGYVNPQGELSFHYFGRPRRRKLCIFEKIYFAKKQSYIGEQSVQEFRQNTGEIGAAKLLSKGINPDVVIPVLGSGGESGIGMARILDEPMVPMRKKKKQDKNGNEEAVLRTFLLPNQKERDFESGKIYEFEEGDKEKVKGKVGATTDDSLVRGTTTPNVVTVAKNAGVKEVHVFIMSEQVRNPCDLGVNIATKGELAANQWGENQPIEVVEKNLAAQYGAADVTFLGRRDMVAAMPEGSREEDYCWHCFGGPHPFRDYHETFPTKDKNEGDPVRIDVISSWNDFFPNSEDSDDLSTYLSRRNPEVIFLTEESSQLSNQTLELLMNNGVTVFRTHEALLNPSTHSELVRTSKGKIPCLISDDPKRQAYEENYPLSGVTITQELPNLSEVRSIVLKEEVVRDENDTYEIWKQKMEEAKLRTVNAVVARATHFIQEGVDISQGTFPW